MELLCELYEAQTACGRYVVHELTSEVNSRMKCVTKIMAMPGTRTILADLCNIGLVSRDEGGPEFVNASVRTITNARQVGVRMQSKCIGTHRHVCAGTNDMSEKVGQTGTWTHQIAWATEEQLREDKQELKTQEQKKKAMGIVDENKGTSHVQDEMGEIQCTTRAGTAQLVGRAHWDDNKGGWLDIDLCAKARREEVEYIRRHKMYTRVSRETCQKETGKAPIKTGEAETDKGQPGKPNVRARWVAKEYKTHARPELHASTPPLEALKEVLSEVVALVDVRRAYFNTPARRRVFVELQQKGYQAGDEHMCGLSQYSLYGTRDAAQNREEDLSSTLSDSS